MKHTKNQKSLVFLMLSLILLSFVFSTNNIFADTRGIQPERNLNDTVNVNTLVSTVNSYSKSKYDFNYLSVKDKVLKVNRPEFLKLKHSDRVDLMSFTLNAVAKGNLSTRNEALIYRFIENTDAADSATVKAITKKMQFDVIGASKKIPEPVRSGFSTFLGGLILIIALLMTLQLVLDIGFLTSGTFREALRYTGTRNNSGITSSKDLGYRWVSVLAVHVWNDALARNEADIVVWNYVKKGLFRYLLVYSLLVLLISGNLWVILSGIFNVFQNAFFNTIR